MSGRRADPRRALVVALVLLAASVAACSDDGDPEADRREVRAAVAELRAAFAERDIARVCAALSADAQRQIGRLGHDPVEPCAKNMRWLARSVEAERPGVDLPRRIVAVELDGDRAVARMTLGRGAIGRVPLTREDGSWKVDALYGDIPAGRQRDSYR